MKHLFFVMLLSLSVVAQNYHIATLSEDWFKRPVEPSIAINPTNPDNIIGASIRYGDTDAGETRVVNMRY
ncbi:MAG: hypothetical protein KDH95_22865, partial [Calditrichaeota bacterium]|nr:hypothetical protein [Calditrichota bacterium]